MSPARLLALLAVLAGQAAADQAGGHPVATAWAGPPADPRGWDSGSPTSSQRSLRAAAACPAIPSCARCDATNNNSTCKSCKAGYVPTRGSRNCVCPPSRYELCDLAGQCSCQSCGRGFYCPGGDVEAGNGAGADRGQRLSCVNSAASSSDTADSVAALGLTTRSTRASKHSECVTMPGWYMTSLSPLTQAAARCTGPTYSAGGNRRTACRPCQDGSEVDNTLPAGALQTSSGICKVPAGRFMQGNQITACPPGTFRAGQAGPSSVAARACTACAPGWTTAAQESKSLADCNVGSAGYELSGVQPGQAASLCAHGTYYDGSAVASGQRTCRPCPDGTVTLRRGAESEGECGVPPGYYIKTGEGLARCPTNLTRADGTREGFYRAGWVDVSQRDAVKEGGDGSAACSPCGSGILSDPTEDDDNPLAPAGSKAATSSDACYITAGSGILPDPDRGGSVPKAVPCPSNTYGAAGAPGSKVYGLTGSPCAPCPRGTVSPPMSTSQDNCTVPPGYGVTDSAVTQCADGYYSAGGARVGACSRCPPGRTTVPGSVSPSTEQASIHNCYVTAGFGLSFKGLATGANPFVPPAGLTVPATTVLSTATAAVVQCPVGYYGEGGSTSNVNTLCRACPEGVTTEQARSTSAANCSLCLAGFGNTASSGGLQCAMCGFGSYSTWASTQACTPCPTTTFGFASSFGDAEDFVSDGTTLKQASTSPALCVVRANQPDQAVGQSFALDNAPGWSSIPDASSASACVASCARDSCCFAVLEHTSATQGACSTLTLAALPPYDVPASGLQLLVKLLPSDSMGSSSVGTQSVASGSYTQCDASAWVAAGVEGLGRPLDGANAGWLANSRGSCQVRCDSLSECWGFFYDRTAGACLLRTGSPNSDTRSFFVAPSALPCANETYYAEPYGCTACPAGTALNAARTGCANPGTNSSLGPACAQAVSSRFWHTMALLGDGTVRAWGRNVDGQLGDNTTTDRSSPVAVQGLSGVRAVSAGSDISVALLEDGTVRAWGNNDYQQIGDGSTGSPVLSPVVVQGLSGVRAVSAGVGYAMAVLEDGTVQAWGVNPYGQLGDGTSSNKRPFPAAVPGLAGVRAISAGPYHVLALLEDGTVRAWGSNLKGQLGDGSILESLLPRAVQGLSGVRAVAAGDWHSMALHEDGTVSAWGNNNFGQLGDGTFTSRSTPTAVPGLTGVRAISVSVFHSVALLENATAAVWGWNAWRQLGDGTNTDRPSPAVIQGLTRVRAVWAASSHTGALLEDGTAWAVGGNGFGELGDGTTTDRFLPVATLGFGPCGA